MSIESGGGAAMDLFKLGRFSFNISAASSIFNSLFRPVGPKYGIFTVADNELHPNEDDGRIQVAITLYGITLTLSSS